MTNPSNAILVPCATIRAIIDKMVAGDYVNPEEFAQTATHVPNCAECLDYLSSKQQDSEK